MPAKTAATDSASSRTWRIRTGRAPIQAVVPMLAACATVRPRVENSSTPPSVTLQSLASEMAKLTSPVLPNFWPAFLKGSILFRSGASREGVTTSPRCASSPATTSAAGTSATPSTAAPDRSPRERATLSAPSGMASAPSSRSARPSHAGTTTAMPMAKAPKTPR